MERRFFTASFLEGRYALTCTVYYYAIVYCITNMGMIFLTLLLSYCNDSTITSISCIVRLIRGRNKSSRKIL